MLLNYSNPMSMNMQTITRTSGVQAVGLCHSVQGTLDQLMGYIGEDPKQVAFVCAGINHMAFYLRLEKDGVDLYPRLFEAMERAGDLRHEQGRFELMRRLGLLRHRIERAQRRVQPVLHPAWARNMVERFDVPIDEYLRRCDRIVEEFERLKEFGQSRRADRRSVAATSMAARSSTRS